MWSKGNPSAILFKNLYVFTNLVIGNFTNHYHSSPTCPKLKSLFSSITKRKEKKSIFYPVFLFYCHHHPFHSVIETGSLIGLSPPLQQAHPHHHALPIPSPLSESVPFSQLCYRCVLQVLLIFPIICMSYVLYSIILSV